MDVYAPGTGASEVDKHLTPVSRRVSKAKKGQFVHVCEICEPARVFSRAEHLRRHQLGHGEPKFFCSVASCQRGFHRADLLLRHESRHCKKDLTSPGHGWIPSQIVVSNSGVSSPLKETDEKFRDVYTESLSGYTIRRFLPTEAADIAMDFGEHTLSETRGLRSAVAFNRSMSTKSQSFATHHADSVTLRPHNVLYGASYVVDDTQNQFLQASTSSTPLYSTDDNVHSLDLENCTVYGDYPSYQIQTTMSSEKSGAATDDSDSSYVSYDTSEFRGVLSSAIPRWPDTIPTDFYKEFLATSASYQTSMTRSQRHPDSPIGTEALKLGLRSLVGNDLEGCTWPLMPMRASDMTNGQWNSSVAGVTRDMYMPATMQEYHDAQSQYGANHQFPHDADFTLHPAVAVPSSNDISLGLLYPEDIVMMDYRSG